MYKSKLVAILLAFFLGGIGMHKFYLGLKKQGILHILFCWTFIPSLIGAVDGIRYIFMSNEEFNSKYCIQDAPSMKPEKKVNVVKSSATTDVPSKTFCPSCGKEIDDNTGFCPFCGAKID